MAAAHTGLETTAAAGGSPPAPRMNRTTVMNRFDPLRKLMHVDEAVARFAAQPATVFTNGVFDLLHRGHIAFLAEARQLGDRLVVAINSDTSARLLGKGPDHPMNAEGDRAFLVAALESVDAVVIVNDTSPIALLSRLRPSVYVKGDDHDMARMAESALVHGWGGHAVALPFADGFSTTSVMERLRRASRLVPADAS